MGSAGGKYINSFRVFATYTCLNPAETLRSFNGLTICVAALLQRVSLIETSAATLQLCAVSGRSASIPMHAVSSEL